MFDPEFFPTPRPIAERMLEPYLPLIREGKIGSVLDPSAGKGDLLAPILRMSVRPRLYAIEKVPELRAALAAKEVTLGHSYRTETPIRVLGDDVFTYQGRHVFNLIVMNPPFSNGPEHLQKAWSLLAPGGYLVCLLNTETLSNAYTVQRQCLRDLVRAHGSSEDLGAVFKEAERRTDVRVCLVRLEKPEAAEEFDFRGARRETSTRPSFKPEDLENQIARRDIVGNAVAAYEAAALALAELSKSWRRAEHYLSLAGVDLGNLVPMEHRAKADPRHLNDLIDAAQSAAWHYIIEQSHVERYFTAAMRKDFDTFMQGQKSLDFNKPNILALFETIFQSRASIADRCVQDVFDRMCSYDKKNKIEGWKTNSGHRVNQKVILPGFINHDLGRFRLSYHRDYSELNDIDKALCHVTGRDYAGITTLNQALAEAFKDDGNVWAESTFFECRFYKRGTLHLKFRDRKVWEMFNVAAARGRGWLGEAAA